ncbi:hypothetical protein A0H81_02420 [Grifola frondosa]|uniref:Uncharacterized protein n=1 Tax=Grifola frondosa TaxID=5627 RepID=A0A1C7MNH4_GRIFR|nr:hypothetical protein A0H81_02420 [Grifola frondosa]
MLSCAVVIQIQIYSWQFDTINVFRDISACMQKPGTSASAQPPKTSLLALCSGLSCVKTSSQARSSYSNENQRETE